MYYVYACMHICAHELVQVLASTINIVTSVCMYVYMYICILLICIMHMHVCAYEFIQVLASTTHIMFRAQPRTTCYACSYG
jgi:hypothetical protein